MVYYFYTVPMRQCSREHSCMSCTFCVAILNITCFFRSLMIDFIFVGDCYETNYYNKKMLYTLASLTPFVALALGHIQVETLVFYSHSQ